MAFPTSEIPRMTPNNISDLGHDDWAHTLTVETPARLLAF